MRNGRALRTAVTWALAVASTAALAEGVAPGPDRKEGEGPYTQLVLRNVVVINGTGAPAFGPADVVIEGDRITQVMSVGVPGSATVSPSRPKLKGGGREIDLAGHYVMPGIVDMHGHIGGEEQGVTAEVGSSRVDLQACKLEYSIVSPK